MSVYIKRTCPRTVFSETSASMSLQDEMLPSSFQRFCLCVLTLILD